jgi:ribosomal protein S14
MCHGNMVVGPLPPSSQFLRTHVMSRCALCERVRGEFNNTLFMLCTVCVHTRFAADASFRHRTAASQILLA